MDFFKLQKSSSRWIFFITEILQSMDFFLLQNPPVDGFFLLCVGHVLIVGRAARQVHLHDQPAWSVWSVSS